MQKRSSSAESAGTKPQKPHVRLPPDRSETEEASDEGKHQEESDPIDAGPLEDLQLWLTVCDRNEVSATSERFHRDFILIPDTNRKLFKCEVMVIDHVCILWMLNRRSTFRSFTFTSTFPSTKSFGKTGFPLNLTAFGIFCQTDKKHEKFIRGETKPEKNQ